MPRWRGRGRRECARHAKMRKTELLIVPGSSSPHAAGYRRMYGDLLFEARFRGFTVESALLLPGQLDSIGSPHRRFRETSAAMLVCNHLRSTGRGQEQIPDNRILWVNWEVFVENMGRDKVGKGTRLVPDLEFFQDLTRFEHLLKYSSHPVHIAGGSEDWHCSPHFLDYLKGLARAAEIKNIAGHKAGGCGHKVTGAPRQNWRGYAEEILGQARLQSVGRPTSPRTLQADKAP